MRTEQYYLHLDPCVNVLATTLVTTKGPHSSNGPVAMPVVYTKLWGKGRVFYSSLGHVDRIYDEVPEALEIARRSRGTPRLANRLLKRVRDWAQVRGDGIIDEDVAAQALSFFEVDALGLDMMDNRILELLAVQFGGRPVGLTTLASALSEDTDTLEDVYEPYLMQQGLLVRTPKGRICTERAYDHLGIPVPPFS